MFPVLPLPHCDPGGFQDEEEAEEDLKTPTIENVLSLNEVNLTIDELLSLLIITISAVARWIGRFIECGRY